MAFGKLSIAFDRALYGTAINSLKYNGIEYIYNVYGPSENEHGGASLQSAFFYKTDSPLDYEFNNPIEAHGFWDLGFTPPIKGVDAPFLLGKLSSNKIQIVGHLQYWFNPIYQKHTNPGDRSLALAPGAHHDALSDTYISKTYTLGNIGTDENPKINDHILVADIAVRKEVTENVVQLDVLTGYHFDTKMPAYYEYDPRTKVIKKEYPYDTNNVEVTVVVDYAGNISTSFTAGKTLTGRVLETGDKILLTRQTDPSQNGVWMVTSGALSKVNILQGYPYPHQVNVLYGTWKSTQWTNTSANKWERTLNYGFLPQIVSSANGDRAIAMWTPQIPLTNESGPAWSVATGIYTRTRFYTGSDVNGWEIGMRPPTIGTEIQRYKAYLLVGTLSEVTQSLDWLYSNSLKALSPSVFDWKFYRDNTLKKPSMNEDQVRLNWLTVGAVEGLLGKKGFDWASKPVGQDNFSYLLSKVA